MNIPPYDVAFVTVNRNTRQLTEDLIAFFRKTEFPFSHRLVVVDNASTDGSEEMLEKEEGITYVRTGENAGYARGINRGLQAVDSRYVCIMNTDVVLNRESLAALWHFFENTATAGVASPVIKTKDGRLQGFVFFDAGLLEVYSDIFNYFVRKFWQIRIAFSRAPLQVPGLHGSFFMIRRSCIGGDTLFDEDFFFYYEDTDLAHRMMKRGISSYILPMVSIVHLGGQSPTVQGGILPYASRYHYVEKHFGRAHMVCVRILDLLRVRLKYAKYALLSRIVRTARIKSKHHHYARLLCALNKGGHGKAGDRCKTFQLGG